MKQLLFGIHLPVMGFSSYSSISIGNNSDSNNKKNEGINTQILNTVYNAMQNQPGMAKARNQHINKSISTVGLFSTYNNAIGISPHIDLILFYSDKK
jgi:hypothetical protein